ncbi:MAG: serine/threonine protein kinase, partial [Myxococcales bacterium]|nr:serine/threonine protein kinase [Myxococcales bacterium]
MPQPKRTSSGAAERNFGDAAVEQSEHLTRLLRLKKAATIALVAWPLFGVVDWFIVGFVHPGRLWYYLLLRAVGLVLIGLAAFRLHKKPAPSPRLLSVLDTGVFATLAGLISLASVECGGLESPLALGVVTVLLCRSALLHDNWRHAIMPVGLAASMHPLSLAVLTIFSPEMQAQLADSRAIGAFVLNELFIAGAAALTLIGGHAVWALRRKVFETRSLGRYRLKQRIGKGGMGEVWLAHHRNLGRDVAVKILRPDKHIEAEAMRRFEREVRATADLCHPNTVRVFDYGVTDDGLCYYAMELLEGEDLGQMIERKGRVEPARALDFMRQAASALAEAHARGIVHRDIKPENLFVTRVTGQGELIKVLDFGLAKHDIAPGEDGLTSEGFAVGTPAYISPEVLHGHDAEPRSDIYGLGCVLYHLLSGSPPFADDNPRQVLLGHMCKEPPPLSPSVLERAPDGTEELLARCLAKNVDQRFADALALSEALEALLDPRRARARSRERQRRREREREREREHERARAERHRRRQARQRDAARARAPKQRRDDARPGPDAAELPTTMWAGTERRP